MSFIATGTYQNGQIKLDSIPSGIERARVRVEFEDTTPPQRRKFTWTFGMLATNATTQANWEDFQTVKRQWQPKET